MIKPSRNFTLDFLESLIIPLEEDINFLISQFSYNAGKLRKSSQAIAKGKKAHTHKTAFKLNGICYHCDDEVKLLGVTIDF